MYVCPQPYSMSMSGGIHTYPVRAMTCVLAPVSVSVDFNGQRTLAVICIKISISY